MDTQKLIAVLNSVARQSVVEGWIDYETPDVQVSEDKARGSLFWIDDVAAAFGLQFDNKTGFSEKT